MIGADGRPADRAPAAPVAAATAVTAAATLALTGVVLARLPATRAMHADHALVSVAADAVGWCVVLVVAAAAAVAGGEAWRRWAALAALAEAATVVLAWPAHRGPVALQHAEHLRLPAVAALGVALLAGAPPRPSRARPVRRVAAVAATLAAGLGALPGLRPVTATGSRRALADALASPSGRAVAVVALAFAFGVERAGDRRTSGLAALAVAVVAGAALAGDVVRSAADGLGGTARLAVRGLAVVAAAVAGAWLLAHRGAGAPGATSSSTPGSPSRAS